jgi:topoisomerase-4 subunit B
MNKKIVYENENSICYTALDIEDDMENLRYNIVIATDADVDGMHSLAIDYFFFYNFFWLIKDGHLYILQTPLFRVRNKKETIYCYSEEERKAIEN